MRGASFAKVRVPAFACSLALVTSVMGVSTADGASGLPNPCSVVTAGQAATVFGGGATAKAKLYRNGTGLLEVKICTFFLSVGALQVQLQSARTTLAGAAPVPGQIVKRESQFGPAGRLTYGSNFTTLIFATPKYWADIYLPAAAASTMLKFGMLEYRALSRQ